MKLKSKIVFGAIILVVGSVAACKFTASEHPDNPKDSLTTEDTKTIVPDDSVNTQPLDSAR